MGWSWVVGVRGVPPLPRPSLSHPHGGSGGATCMRERMSPRWHCRRVRAVLIL